MTVFISGSTVQFLQSEYWYSGNSDTSAAEKSQTPLSCLHIDSCDISQPPVTYTINFFHYEDTCSTVSWSLGIPGRNWGDCRKHRKGPWCSWTSNWRRHSIGIHFWLVVHVKCRSSDKYYLSKLSATIVVW